jgi:DNA-binding transcriptional MocR family regulator
VTAHHLSDLHATLQPGVLDLGLGHPDPALLPVDAIRRASAQAIARYGTHALGYGYATGPGPLADWLRDRIAQREGRMPDADEIAITGGISHALDQLVTLCTQPGDVALVESPTYHLAVRILRDRLLKLVAIPGGPSGPDPAALSELIASLKRRGERPSLLYGVPTFNNPTGLCWRDEVRRAVVALAARERILIVEDDAYRELVYDGEAPPSLWCIAPAGIVARLGSFSKSLAPGMRVGWITAGRDVIARIRTCGVMDSGGGPNQFAAMTVTAYCCEDGVFDEQVERFREAYRTRRDALMRALAAHLPTGWHARTPAGGFFVWLRLPPGVSSEALLPLAEAEGVSFLPGRRFFCDGHGGDDALRLAFTLYSPAQLEEAAMRLAQAVRRML